MSLNQKSYDVVQMWICSKILHFEGHVLVHMCVCVLVCMCIHFNFFKLYLEEESSVRSRVRNGKEGWIEFGWSWCLECWKLYSSCVGDFSWFACLDRLDRTVLIVTVKHWRLEWFTATQYFYLTKILYFS